MTNHHRKSLNLLVQFVMKIMDIVNFNKVKVYSLGMRLHRHNGIYLLYSMIVFN